MKCHLMQNPKHKLSAEDKRKLQGIVNEYITLSTVVGEKKALEIVKEKEMVGADND